VGVAQTDERLAAALRYAARGLRVLPVYGIEDGRCRCGRQDCRTPGKHPMTRHGVLAARTDPETIGYWWQHAPDANTGIACGPETLVLAATWSPRHTTMHQAASMSTRRHTT
jgi:hypothetical protein